MRKILAQLAWLVDDAHALTHIARMSDDEDRIPVYDGVHPTGLYTDRVRFTYVTPAGARAERLHEIRAKQEYLFAQIADHLLTMSAS